MTSPIITMYELSSTPVRKIISTLEENHQYPWGKSSVPVRHTHSTHEDFQYTGENMQCPWENFIHLRVLVLLTHGYWWSPSWILHILTGNMGYASRVLQICLTGTEDSFYRVNYAPVCDVVEISLQTSNCGSLSMAWMLQTCFWCRHIIATNCLVHNGGCTQNWNKQYKCIELWQCNRTYLVTKAMQNLNHTSCLFIE